MHKLTFFPLGNADTLYIDLEGNRIFVEDYADMRNASDKYDLRWDIKSDITNKLKAKNRQDVDTFCITHLDNEHVCGAADFFYLEHATKYQTEGRYKIKELWVPAGAITEEGAADDARTWRQEARYRLKQGVGIRVFGRPERLKDWLNVNGLTLESRQHLITDAGQIVPGYTKTADGVEFFLHSPHAHRINERDVEDRNQDSIVMQATFQSGGVDTRVILGGDTTWERMEDIVSISKSHGNTSRLEFEVFKLPHHCSYKALSDIKGATETEPKPLVKEWFELASRRAIVISTSDKIVNADQVQPPHFQAKNYHVKNMNRVSGQFKVTMEHPTMGSPKPLVLKIDSFGAAIEVLAAVVTGGGAAAGQTPPRAGNH